jgi:hypothetical protein
MCHRLAADHKGALGPGAPYLIGQVIERLHPDVQPPGKLTARNVYDSRLFKVITP